MIFVFGVKLIVLGRRDELVIPKIAETIALQSALERTIPRAKLAVVLQFDHSLEVELDVLGLAVATVPNGTYIAKASIARRSASRCCDGRRCLVGHRACCDGFLQ